MDDMTRLRAIGSAPRSHVARVIHCASKAPRSHCSAPPSIATTSKRHGGGVAQAQQVVPRREHQAALLGRADAGRRAAMARVGTRAHLDEHQRAVALAQDQVDLAAARVRPARDPIIALDQRQALALQVRQRARLGRVAALLLVGCRTAAGDHRRHLRCHCRDHRPGRRGCRRRAAVSRRRAVRGGHADRQPGRPDAARAACARRWSTRWPARTRATAAAAAPPRPSTSRCSRCTSTTSTPPAPQVLARLARGERVAYVSDAGTPAVSDPGAALVAAAQAAGYRAVPMPGASSVLAALSVAGDADAAAASPSSASCRPRPASATRALAALAGRRATRRCCSRRRTASRRWLDALAAAMPRRGA